MNKMGFIAEDKVKTSYNSKLVLPPSYTIIIIDMTPAMPPCGSRANFQQCCTSRHSGPQCVTKDIFDSFLPYKPPLRQKEILQRGC